MFGLGLLEIIILLFVVGGLVYALRGRHNDAGESGLHLELALEPGRLPAVGWVLRGLAGAVLCCLLFICLLFIVAYFRHFEEREQGATVVQEAEALTLSADVAAQSRTEALGRIPSVIAPKPLPDWITAADDQASSQVVIGSQFANRQDAFADALDKATNVVSEKFRQSRPVGWWRPDGSDVYNHSVRKKYTEEIIRSAGENEFTVYRTYLLVDLSPGVLSKLESIWRTETKVLHRSQVLIVVAILTGIAALLAGFFRLDDRTQGRYRWPLIGATVVGIALLAAVPVLAGDCIERCQQRHSMLEIEPQRREGHKGFAKNCLNPPRHGSCFADE